MSDTSKQPESEITRSKTRALPKFQDLDIIEIDLYEKAKSLWDGRRTILIFVIACLVLGYFHVEYGPTEYNSTASVIQESEGAASMDIGSSFLRSITGMNIQSSSGNLSAAATGRAPLPVSLYPKIISSTGFQKELIYTELEFSKLDTTITLYDYYHEFNEPALRDKVYSFVGDMTIFLPFTVYDWIKDAFGSLKSGISGLWKGDSGSDNERTANSTDEDVIVDERLQSITSKEMAVINWMRLRIDLLSEGGIIEITTRLPDPKAAAVVNAHLVEHIQDYIKDYRIKKAKQNLDAVLERYQVAKERYEEAQNELAEFRDQNLNLTTNAAQIEESRLSNEVSLRSSVYNSVAQEVEQARMILQRQIPVFNPLEKPNVPTSPSTGSSPLLLVFSGVLGFFGGVGWVLIRNTSLF